MVTDDPLLGDDDDRRAGAHAGDRSAEPRAAGTRGSGTGSGLSIPDDADRETLGAVAARAVRLQSDALVRLRARTSERVGDAVEAWVSTPFEVLVTRAVPGTITPADVTVPGNDLLAALTVAGGQRMDPGPARDVFWQSELPAVTGWHAVEDLPAHVVADLAEQGVGLARDNVGPLGTPPASLMDQTVLTVHDADREIKIPMRCLFAMSGMGFLGSEVGSDAVRVRATEHWLRLDARYGAVVRRRKALLPLLM